jgi:hypothetical protein
MASSDEDCGRSRRPSVEDQGCLTGRVLGGQVASCAVYDLG